MQRQIRQFPCWLHHRLSPLFLSLVIFLLSVISRLSLAQENIVLQVANWGGAEEVKSEEEIVQKFMAGHPGVKVVFETIPSGYKEKILTRIAGGNPPDVFLLDSIILPAFFRHQILVDLIPYIKKYQIDLSAYFPNVLAIAQQDSQLFAIPKDFNSLLMFYNKNLFDQAGLPYPQTGWSWDDYLTVCRKLTHDVDGDGRIDQYGTALSVRFFLWQPWLWLCGGDLLSPDGSQASGYLNSPASLRAVTFLADLKRQYQVTPESQSLSSQGLMTSLFFTGRIATMVNGHWLVLAIREYLASSQLRIGVVSLPLPPGGTRATVMYESGWCVAKGVKNEALAAELALFLGGETAARLRSQSSIAIPAIKKIAEEQLRADPWGIEQAFYDEIPYCRQPWGTRVEEFHRLELISEDAMDAVMNRGAAIAATFDRAARQIDLTLAESRQLQNNKTSEQRTTPVWWFLLLVVLMALLGLFLFGLMQKGRERRKFFEGLRFLIPSLLLLLVFVLTPLVSSLFLSVHQWNIISLAKPFVGLHNFRRLFHDPQFLNALKNTAIFTLQVPASVIISLLIAMMMNQRLKGVNFLRTLFFLPSVSSFVAIALVWQWLYHPQFGLANYLLSQLGLAPFSWLSAPKTALFSIMIMTIWVGIGYQMVIFLAGLQGIPEFLYEVARIDGATVWQRLRYVTLPMLLPTTFFVLITAVIGSFQVFTSVYVMTEGGPARSTDVVVYHIYQEAWEYLRLGEASAMSWLLFGIILIATYLQFKVVGKRMEYG